MALCLGLPRWASTRKVKPIWISLRQETVSGSGISWAICKSAPHSRQTTMPVPHSSVFYRPDALSDTQPTASMHWRQKRAGAVSFCHRLGETLSLYFVQCSVAVLCCQGSSSGGAEAQCRWVWVQHRRRRGRRRNLCVVYPVRRTSRRRRRPTTWRPAALRMYLRHHTARQVSFLCGIVKKDMRTA